MKNECQSFCMFDFYPLKLKEKQADIQKKTINKRKQM